MVDSKIDDTEATGTHPVWRPPVLDSVGPAGPAARWKGARPWAERPAPPANHRHSAITRTLYSLRSYKSWADKVRSGWVRNKDEDGPEE